MSQSESAYSAIADWHWTTSNTPEVAIWAPYGDVGTSQRRSGDVRTWGHVGKIGPWEAKLGETATPAAVPVRRQRSSENAMSVLGRSLKGVSKVSQLGNGCYKGSEARILPFPNNGQF